MPRKPFIISQADYDNAIRKGPGRPRKQPLKVPNATAAGFSHGYLERVHKAFADLASAPDMPATHLVPIGELQMLARDTLALLQASYARHAEAAAKRSAHGPVGRPPAQWVYTLVKVDASNNTLETWRNIDRTQLADTVGLKETTLDKQLSHWSFGRGRLERMVPGSGKTERYIVTRESGTKPASEQK